MGVRVKRDGDASVAQALAHDLRMNAAGEKQASVRVPEIMEPQRVNTRLLHHTPEGTPEVAGEDRRPHRRGKDKTVVLIAANGPLAVRKIKEAVLRTSGLPLEDAYRVEDECVLEVMRSEDAREGPQAFIEKREPQYKGR